MKRSLVATSAILSLFVPALLASCALEDAPPPSTSGGTTGTSGSSTGGTAGTGGATGGTAGTAGTGGTGGDTGGTGGTAGTAGTGGTGGDTGGTGGTATAITVDDLAGTVNEFGFAFKDSFMLTACTSTENWDCLTVTTACPNQDAENFEDRGSTFKERFALGGEAGKMYDVTIQVNGVTEAKFYRLGTRRRGDDYSNADDPNGTDTWYIGGEPIPSPYNVEKITVFQPDGTTELQHYYLNSFPEASGYEAHRTFLIGYEATFEVPGGGYVEFLNQDSNCRAINNCGAGVLNGADCPEPRDVPHEPGLMVPQMFGGQPTANMNSINGAQQPFHSQIVHVTVTDVVEQM
jgi:hypothetical protein